jgi:flagellar motility protein MotE (MotC chaperone)
MLKEVYDFNKIRNGFKYDRELEMAMYAEEVKEFFDANTTAERLDALVDCSYVRMGTMLKLAYNNKSVNDLPYERNVEQIMVSILVEEIGQELFDRVIRLAEEIVCDCNSKKLIKTNKNGKVVKGDIPDATKLIDEMLKDKFEERDAILNAQAKKQQEIFDSYTQDSTKNP